MAGYYGYSKSNNAIDAESENKYPASVAAKKLGVGTKAIQTLMVPCEWHHTSIHYNRTDYYDVDRLLDVKNGLSTDEDDIDLYNRLKTFKVEKLVTEVYTADVKYLTWSGTRKHPKATEHRYENIKVLEKGCFYTFYTPHGEIKKKIGSHGTYVSRNENS